MRSALPSLPALLVLLASSAAAADATPKGWPAAGRCIAPWPSQKACIQISPADAAAIQRAIVGYLDAAQLKGRPDYRPAKVIAQRPITSGAIGGFLIYGYESVGFTGDVIEAIAVESHRNGAERGFKVTLGRKAGGWVVLYFEHYYEPDPQLD